MKLKILVALVSVTLANVWSTPDLSVNDKKCNTVTDFDACLKDWQCESGCCLNRVCYSTDECPVRNQRFDPCPYTYRRTEAPETTTKVVLARTFTPEFLAAIIGGLAFNTILGCFLCCSCLNIMAWYMRSSTRRRFRKGAQRQAKHQDLKVDHRATKAEIAEIKASMMGKPKQVVPKS